MGRKAEARPAEAVDHGSRVIAGSTTHQSHPSVSSAPDALIALAEELGRLLARRLLTDPGRRRGYGLPELLLGAAVMAVAWALVVRFLEYFSR